MAFSDVFERLGRAVFEAPFDSKRLAEDAPELAEIRIASIDAVKAKSHRVSGQNVFAFDLVRVKLLGVPAEQEPVFRSEFMLQYFGDELKAALRRASFRFPEKLAVEFVTTPRLPLPGETWLSVETAMREAPSAVTTPAVRPATLNVLDGDANRPQILLDKARVNIGRTKEVFRGGGPSRRNDLAFSGDDEVGKTVSREHAHIVRSTAGNEYRLFNDRSYKGDANCGLWIVRDGMSLPVHRSPHGMVLQAGDEIHFGTARVGFTSEGEELPGDR